jgi:hypothetical protein
MGISVFGSGNAGRDAICLNRRCIGWRCRWGSPARGCLEASLTTDGADSGVGRNEGAAAGNCGGRCRVTADFPRLVECSAVAGAQAREGPETASRNAHPDGLSYERPRHPTRQHLRATSQ